MEQLSQTNNHPVFNEEEWIRLIFLLSDTSAWLDSLIDSAFRQPPISGRKRLFRNTYYLSVGAMAHIIERHYHKIQRHPSTGKFTIPLMQLLEHVRDASSIIPCPVAGSDNQQRLLELKSMVGFDRNGHATSKLTILTDNAGNIITAFPGTIK